MKPKGSNVEAEELLEIIGAGHLELRDALLTLRKIAGLSQKEMAARAGVGSKVVAALEARRNVSLASLKRLATANGLRVTLIGGPAISLYSPDQRAREKQAARAADAAAVRAGTSRESLRQRNALGLGDQKLELKPLYDPNIRVTSRPGALARYDRMLRHKAAKRGNGPANILLAGAIPNMKIVREPRAEAFNGSVSALIKSPDKRPKQRKRPRKSTLAISGIKAKVESERLRMQEPASRAGYDQLLAITPEELPRAVERAYRKLAARGKSKPRSR